MSGSLISVVTCTYNAGRYLWPSLESVLAQEGVDLEIVVVDDGSTDESPAVLAELAARDRRVRVLRQENRGLTQALSRGCAEARGRLIARHDTDDLSLPGRLARQAKLLEVEDRLAFVSCWLRTIGPEGELLFETARPEDAEEATRLLTGSLIGPYHGSAMFRAEAYRRVGGYRPDFRYAQDWDLWLRLADVGPVAYVPEFLYAFRVSGGSISARRRDQQRRLAQVALRCHEARRQGRSEVPHLAEAARLSAEPESPPGRSCADNSYFVGKCLLDRRDPRSRKYLWRSVRSSPFHVRGWIALAAAGVLCRQNGEDLVEAGRPPAGAVDEAPRVHPNLKPQHTTTAIESVRSPLGGGTPGARDFYEAQLCSRNYATGADPSVQGLIRDFVVQFGLEDKKVLEIGCGRGWLQNAVCDWTGVDLAVSAGTPIHKPFVCAEASRLPFAEQAFDCVWSIHTLEHVPQLESCLNEVARVLKPGGLALLKPAWFCRPWAAGGCEVRPWRSLTWPERFVKASIPLRNALWFRALMAVPPRLVRELAYCCRRRPTRLHHRRLAPNYEVYWQSDSDACNAIDPHDVILWFTSRGWAAPWADRFWRRMVVRTGALIFRKRSNSPPARLACPEETSCRPFSAATPNPVRETPAVSIAIPTLGREAVLVETVAGVLRLDPPAREVIVVDQSPRHEPATAQQLAGWDSAGAIRWVRLDRPSIPRAMNRALLEAASPVVLFLDDDVVPSPGLVAAHLRNYADAAIASVVGQVLQPGQHPERAPDGPRGTGLREDLEFRFNGTARREVLNCIACNWSVRRDHALRVGGFDENFVGVAYRFETEFCRRLARDGGKTVFDPSASVRHLQAPRGGTRTYGNRLRSARPEHAVGDYYFALLAARGLRCWTYIGRRMFREVHTRYHLAHPWWIPVKLVGEVRGLYWAVWLARRGPRHIRVGAPPSTMI